jgi:trans-aconitate 2-methyltransferase
MREIAARGPWAARLAPGVLGRLPIEAPRTHYDCLKPLCAHVEIWNIVYNHVLTGADALTEWLIGAGLRPYLDLLDPEEAKAFLETYQDALAQAYPPRIDGKILFRFPRLFIVAVKS